MGSEVSKMGELEPGGYTLGEAAIRLNCHRNTVKNMVRAKELRTYRVGKRGIRVAKDSVDQRLAGERTTGRAAK